MSVIRFSVIKHALYAPLPDGEFASHAYNAEMHAGILGSTLAPARTALRESLGAHLDAVIPLAVPELSSEHPVALLVHGFGFDPTDPLSTICHQTTNPHGRIFHEQRLPHRREKFSRSAGWLLGMGLGEVEDRGKQGLALGLGWYSDPLFMDSLMQFGAAHYAQAREYAKEGAAAAAELLTAIAQRVQPQPLDIVAHGMGAQVVLDALAELSGSGSPALKRLGRIVFLGGAATCGQAGEVFGALAKQGATPEVYNLVSRRDNTLRVLSESAGEETEGGAMLLGYDGWMGTGKPEGWIDLQLDRLELVEWILKNLGLRVSGREPEDTWDHWYYVTHRDNLEFCRRILRRAKGMDAADLLGSDAPLGVSGDRKRWRYEGRDTWDSRTEPAWERLG